ncbi:unnamed protein product, partial [Polarella glacialis]
VSTAPGKSFVYSANDADKGLSGDEAEELKCEVARLHDWWTSDVKKVRTTAKNKVIAPGKQSTGRKDSAAKHAPKK